MAATPPTIEPTRHQIGDTLSFTRSLPDYPASLWTLTYYLRGSANTSAIDIVATADGDDYEIIKTAAVTAAWKAGTYTMVGCVADADERYEVYRGTIELTANVPEADTHDGRTFWERIRDKLRTVIEEGVIRETIRYSYNGVSTEVATMKDAFDALAYAESKVKQEQGGSKQRKILTRFVCPR